MSRYCQILGLLQPWIAIRWPTAPLDLFDTFHWILRAWPGEVVLAKVRLQTFKNGAGLVSLGANRISGYPRNPRKQDEIRASTERRPEKIISGRSG
ncbi:hypothetical protein IG631_23071 [Alternaria alternata]|nr:hypothetical protein IG631_23071 [Alternaria alternata]